MSELDMSVEWLDPPPEDEAFGPERATWARLVVDVGGVKLTQNHPADRYARADVDFVTGPMSGLAEWIVANWVSVLWEIHAPFPKHAAGLGERDRIPSLRDAHGGWRDFADSAVDRVALARWQHRHSLGHAASSIALPSIVLLPEERHVGIAIDHLPTQLGPSVRFSLESGESILTWIPRDVVAAALARLVDDVLSRVDAEESLSGYGRWLRAAWDESRTQAASDVVRRRLRVGDFVAEQWAALATRLGPDATALDGILCDVDPIRGQDTLEVVMDMLARLSEHAAHAAWRELAAPRSDGLLPPHEQGYRLARRVRERLGRPDEPIVDLNKMLADCGIATLPAVNAGPLFRSAAVASAAGSACVVLSMGDQRFTGLAPTRFATAAGFGRLLGDRPPATGVAFGAAQGPHSRWIATKRANAFAAELLLPETAIRRGGDIEKLCEDYGISRTAASWHCRNVERQPVGPPE